MRDVALECLKNSAKEGVDKIVIRLRPAKHWHDKDDVSDGCGNVRGGQKQGRRVRYF